MIDTKIIENVIKPVLFTVDIRGFVLVHGILVPE